MTCLVRIIPVTIVGVTSFGIFTVFVKLPLYVVVSYECYIVNTVELQWLEHLWDDEN